MTDTGSTTTVGGDSSSSTTTSQPPPPPKSKSFYITWTEEKKLFVATQASKHEAFMPTKKTMEAKWTEVLNKCIQSPIFEEWRSQPPRSAALETAFARWTKDVLKKYGISEEGANLSGLEAEPDEFDGLIIAMAEEKSKKAEEKKKEKEKEKLKAEAIFTHESTQLNKQTKLGAATSETSPAADDAVSNFTVGSNSGGRKRGASNAFGLGFLEDFLREDDRIIDLTVEEKGMEIEFNKKKKNQELDQNQKRFDAEIESEKVKLSLEERKIALEEKRLAMEERRLDTDARIQERQSVIFEALLKKLL